MITKMTPVSELKEMFIEILQNKTDAITDVSSESVLNGVAFGCAKMGEKTLVNIAITEGHIFPDVAYGSYLDELALIGRCSDRFNSMGSSTYIRLMGDEGTVYSASVNKFYSTSGVIFSLENDVTIGSFGYVYAKVKSDSTGLSTNVDPLTINRVNPIPSGHIACTNEYRATGGLDDEDDSNFRVRIKEFPNQLAVQTLTYLEQFFMSINPRVLRLKKLGVDSSGHFNLMVIPTNGVDFTENEFNELLSKSEQYLSLKDQLVTYSDYALVLNNPNWYPVDIEYRVDIDPSVDIDQFRKNSQIQINKLFDYRYWKDTDKVEWENIFFAAKNIDGVRYLPDNFFSPRVDINIPSYYLPRVRGFILRDLNGNIITDSNYVLNNFYYPNESDYSYQTTVL